MLHAYAGVPMERTVDLASALLGHLLSCAPAAPDAPAQQAKKGAAKAAQQAKKKKGRKRKEDAEVPQAEASHSCLQSMNALADSLYAVDPWCIISCRHNLVAFVQSPAVSSHYANHVKTYVVFCSQ